MARKQKEILNKLAHKHGLTIGQAEEVWNLLIDKVATTISDKSKVVDGLYVENEFKIIHIDNFGKFVPNLTNINHANMCLKKKKEKND
jgi:hypothetical protein